MLRGNVKRILISLLLNPIFIIGYWIFGQKLASICKYGSLNKNLPILLLSIVILISVIVFTTLKIIKNSEYKPKLIDLRVWKSISIIIFIAITLFYGGNIYKSATNFGGKLAWYIERLKNERSVKFEHNNIYKYGVEGIFEDINKKITLPKKLYIVNNFSIKFNSDGKITSLYTFIHGKNDNGKEETYLIIYEENKSQNITIRLNGYAKPDYNEDKLVEPLIKTVNDIPIKQTVSKWNENQYGLVYYGKRSWGYNTNGIINIDKDGKEYSLEEASSEIIGYTVSLFVPGKEKVITPVRYNLIGNPSWSKPSTTQNQVNSNEKKNELKNTNEQFYLSKEVGYKLNVADKALGSTFYSLSKTTDGGKTWTVINNDPYSGTVGGASGVVFLDDKLGFLGAVNPSGNEGTLYRTDDGGISFKKVIYSPHEVKLNNGQSIKPFDTPSMPFEMDGVLSMLVGQGSDGDYNGNSSELYQSKDEGQTWKFVKEVKNRHS
ncbi:WD40/YVTN/BNR-like repeat-containing protein [Gottfriedia acidiceleris]|uniref:WD40/YVTN/BNR-like repeat-containing protein n=1 Tax=Gottfriedia acidiceleris TaxID=371036 RepID=UPI003D7F79E6